MRKEPLHRLEDVEALLLVWRDNQVALKQIYRRLSLALTTVKNDSVFGKTSNLVITVQ